PRAATLFAAGHMAAGGISAQAVVLTKGVLKAMLMNKLKAAAAVLLTVGLITAGTGLLTRQALAEKPAAVDRQAEPAPSKHTDVRVVPARATVYQVDVLVYEI